MSQECDDIVSFLLLLQAGKVHFGALDVFLRFGQVIPEVIFRPRNSIISIEVGMTDGRRDKMGRGSKVDAGDIPDDIFVLVCLGVTVAWY